MSLASHAGKSTFAINGKTVNKRSGTDNIYDITSSGGGGGGQTNALVHRMTVPVNTQTGRMTIYRLNQHEFVWYESGSGQTHTVDMSDGGTWTYGGVNLMASGFPMSTQFDASIHDLYVLVDSVWYKVPVSEAWNSYGGGFSGSHPAFSADPATNPQLLRPYGDGIVSACVNQAGEFRWHYEGVTLYNQTSGLLNFHIGLEIRLSG